MYKYSFTYFLLILYLIGCSPSSNHNTTEAQIPTINVKLGRNDNISRISEFLRFSHYVPLQTNPDILINQINKIQIINDKIYILDRKQSSVLIFDTTGTFVSKIQNKGNGPHEYLDISDFEATSDGLLFLNDQMQGKFYVYDEAGNFQRSVQHPQQTWSFKMLPDNKLAFNPANGFGTIGVEKAKYNYVCFSNEGQVLYEALPFNKELIGQKIFNGDYHSLFYQYNNSVYMSSILNDTVYNVSQATGELVPYIAFNFNTGRPNLDDSPQQVRKYLGTLRDGGYPSVPYNFYRFNNGVMASYIYERESYIIIASLSGEMLFSARTGFDEHGIMTYYTPYLDSDNTGYIVAVADNIYEKLDYRRETNQDISLLSDIASRIDDDSNPVLLFYNWVY